MKIQFDEQDVIDGVCVGLGVRENTNPENIDVDLRFNVEQGISAKAKMYGEKIYLDEQDIVDFIAVYLRDFHNFDPEYLKVDVRYDEKEGIYAKIRVEKE